MRCAYLRIEHRGPAQRWAIVHAASGLAVLSFYRSRVAARRELDYVCGLADWSRPWEELAGDEALRAVVLEERARVAHGRPVSAGQSGVANVTVRE